MKNLKLLGSLLFGAVMALILSAATASAVIGGLSFVLLFLTGVGLPVKGVLGQGFIEIGEGMTEAEKRFAANLNEGLKKLEHQTRSGLLTEEQLNIRLNKLIDENKNGVEVFQKTVNEEIAHLRGLMESGKIEKNVHPLQYNLRKIEEVIPKIAEAYDKRQTAEFRINLRANTDVIGLGKIDTTNGIYPDSYLMPGINEKPTVKNILLNLVNKFGVNSTNTIKWIEEVGVEGLADMTAENALKAQISAGWKTDKADIEKVTAFSKATDEMIRFAPMLYNQIRKKIVEAIENKIELQLFGGTGLNNQINGAKKYAKTVTLAGLADSVDSATMVEALQAGITQMYESTHGNFVPNAILVRPVDYFKMRTTKNVDGTPLIPGWMMSDGLKIDDVPIYKSTSSALEAGHFFIMDTTKFNVALASGLEIVIGLTGDDFVYNRVTMRGEQYLGSFVEGNDVDAFIYDSFADVIAFINKPTT